jgi:prepilin-type N-terminal cleavage/methylation domain-containing protein
MSNKPNKRTQGFTIIEVLIVLAIAGIIMLIVFLAVPALQRNSRNNQRRSDVSHMAGLVNEYAANHAGAMPVGTGTAAGYIDITNENFALLTKPTSANIHCASGCGGTSSSNDFPATTDTSTMTVVEGYTCNQQNNTLVAGSGRSFSITYNVETSGNAQNACVNG